MKISLFLLLSAVFFCTAVNAETYYISASGDDSNPGTSDTTAWKTISKLNSFFPNLTAGDVVLFNRGDEFYGTITITKSGSSSSPIIFGAYGTGSKPIITGFKVISEWSNVEGTNIWESTSIPNAPAKLNVLTINGKVTRMGRFPNASDINKGYLTIDTHDSSLSITDMALPSTPNWTGGELVLRRTRWILDRDSIKDHSGNTIYYKPFSATAKPIDGYGYFIQNHPETLDEDGEWYYNPVSKTIKIYSNSAPSSIKIATLSNLVTSSGISYLKLQDLSFTGANTTAISITGTSTNISILNCNISSSGIQGVSSSATNFLLENSTISHSFNKAVGVSGRGSVIRNCLVKNSGTVAGMGGSGNGQYYAVSVGGTGSLMEFCTIDSSGFIGVHLNSDSAIIKNNLINTFCFVKDDGAAIYTDNGAANKLWAGRKIKGNIILNGIGAKEGTNSSNLDAFGIYIDDKSNNIEITDNTVSNVSWGGLYLHNAHELLVKRNTFYNNNKYQVRIVHDGNAPNDPIRNVTLKNNIEFAKTTTQLVGYYGSRTNDIAMFGTFDSNYYCRPIYEPTKVTSGSATSGAIINIVINNGAGKYLSLDRWKDSTGHDLQTKKTSKTVSDTSRIRFEYNATPDNQTIALGEYTYLGVDSTRYSQSITLQPYSSIILLRDSLVKVSPLSATSTATPIPCNGGTTSVTVSAAGGKSPYTGTGTFTERAGSYNYTVTDANGATATTSITVTEPTELKAASEAGAITSNGGTTTVTVSATGGTAPYTGTGEYTKGAGTYSFEVTDANGCTDVTTITISEPPAEALNATSDAGKINCFGGTTKVTVSATGGKEPYNGTGTFTAAAGQYSYTVTDADGATATTSITITEPDALKATSEAGTINCYGGTTTVIVKATGGTAQYTGTGTFTAGAGTHTYSVTDANGCTATTSITITQPAALQLSLVKKTSPTCKKGTNGSIQVSASGGTSPYVYSINNGAFTTNSTFSNLKAGTYTITAKDFNGCTASLKVILADGTGPCKSARGVSITTTDASLANDIELQEIKITAFPNPSQTQFVLSIHGGSREDVKIVVTDLLGLKVYAAAGTINQRYIFGEKFMPGVYILKVMQGKNVEILKLIRL